MSAHLTPEGFARGAVVLATVWYAWICFAWLTNNVGVDDELVRAGVLAAAGASFLVALAVPHALDSEVVLFVSAYFVVRLLHVVLYVYGTRDTPAVRRNALGIAPTFVLARPRCSRCRGCRRSGGCRICWRRWWSTSAARTSPG